ncbi:MAG: ATPase [Clostridiales bacterium]|nr:ATPase [Clostridiales bacterium]
MKVDDLIEQLQNIINEAKSMPFSGGKVLVSSDEVYDILDQIQDVMPAEVRQAKNIVADRKSILAEANRESENIIRSAEERKKAMLNQNALVREAQGKSKEILDDAKKKSTEIKKAANVYVDNIMKRTEESIASQLDEVKKTRNNILNSQRSKPQNRE